MGHSRGVASGPGVQRAGIKGVSGRRSGAQRAALVAGPGTIVGQEFGGTSVNHSRPKCGGEKLASRRGSDSLPVRTNRAFASAFLVKLEDVKSNWCARCPAS